MRAAGVAILLASLAPVRATAQTGAVEARITGIRSSQHGTLVVALYRGEAGWLQLDSALVVRRIPVDADSLDVRFEELAPGDGYAIAVIHDRNGNDRMDMRWFPFPKPREGAGVSENHLRMGKPDYRKAAFAVGDSTIALTIRMRY